MTVSEAAQAPWDWAGSMLGVLGAVAVVLLGLALLREITR